MKIYSPTNWYWYVGGDHTKAFSSSAGDYVPATDPTFVAWLSDGTLPTIIDTESNLGAVLAPYSLRPTNANVLDGYQNMQVTRVDDLQFRIALNHENRIRALAGQATVTAAQFRAALKALM